MTTKNWQQALSDLITEPKELLQLLDIDLKWLDAANAAARLFPLKVPREFVRRIEKNNLRDPLLMQILPIHKELTMTHGFTPDPLKESKVNPLPGVLHKYHGRVLMTLTGACAVNCRFCFRRCFPYDENNPGTSGWDKIIEYINNDKTISEIIFSGGDPLAMSDKRLVLLTEKLLRIPHLKRLRIHTRMPIVLPERITSDFIDWLSQSRSRFSIALVLHSNHPNEINNEVKMGLRLIREKGIVLLNQSVLLKDINDNVETLCKLSELLFENGVLPYYLHLLDKTQGTAHFDVNQQKAKVLFQTMRQLLPGYLVPRFVYEEAGKAFKMLL